jgi:hypothetical protein
LVRRAKRASKAVRFAMYLLLYAFGHVALGLQRQNTGTSSRLDVSQLVAAVLLVFAGAL